MATTAIVSLDDVKGEINDISTVNDTELAGFISAATRVIEDLVGPVLTAQVTEQYGGGSSVIVLKQAPVVSVDTVVEYQGIGPATLTQQVLGVAAAFDGYGYTVDLAAGLIYRTASGCPQLFAAGQQNVVVTYTYGRDPVPGNIRMGMLDLIRVKWGPQRSAGPNTLGQDKPAAAGQIMHGIFVPDAVLAMLAPDRRAPRVG